MARKFSWPGRTRKKEKEKIVGRREQRGKFLAGECFGWRLTFWLRNENGERNLTFIPSWLYQEGKKNLSVGCKWKKLVEKKESCFFTTSLVTSQSCLALQLFLWLPSSMMMICIMPYFINNSWLWIYILKEKGKLQKPLNIYKSFWWKKIVSEMLYAVVFSAHFSVIFLIMTSNTSCRTAMLQVLIIDEMGHIWL